MKFVFFGTPKFAAIILERLIDTGFVPEAIICNPDEPIGRKHILTPPPVKTRTMNYELGIRNRIQILQPEKLDKEFINSLFKIHNSFDVFIVAAYNKIISEEIINLPKFKTIGVHPSLLPKYRGASPIQTAILSGEKETGVDLYLIDKGVDHGPVLATAKCEISEKDNYETMENKLAELGAKLLIENLPKYLTGELKAIEQDHSQATLTKKFSTEDGRVDLEKDPAELIFNKIRALNPDPGVFTFIKTKIGLKRIKLLEAELKDGKLELIKVQPEGKKPMSYKDFLNGIKNSG